MTSHPEGAGQIRSIGLFQTQPSTFTAPDDTPTHLTPASKDAIRTFLKPENYDPH